MANRSPSDRGGKRARLLKAKPLEQSPPAKVQPGGVPPAPIPVGPQTARLGPTPPAPIPVGPQTAGPEQVPPVAPNATPPAPIPVSGGLVGNVAPSPIPIGPSPATDAAAPVVIDTSSQRPRTTRGTPATKTLPDRSSGNGATVAGGATTQPIVLTEEQRKQDEPRVSEQRGRKATGVREELEEREEQGAWALFWRDFLGNQPSWLTSMVFHMGLLILLGVLTIGMPQRSTSLVSLPDSEELEFNEMPELEVEALERGPEALDIVDRDTPESLEPMIDMEHATEGLDSAGAPQRDFMTEVAPWNDHVFEDGRGTGTAHQRGTGKGEKGTGWGLAGKGKGLGGRGGRRGDMIGRGATPESEKAVNMALEWLAKHQLPDGGWSFDHRLAPSCQGKCPDPGEKSVARIGATALGVLPFLGAGQTHQVGKYKKTVRAGLTYLMARIQATPGGGSLYEPEGRMYSHGLATIALCEAYAMRVNPTDLIKPKFYDGREPISSPGDVKSLKQKQQDSKEIAAQDRFNALLGRAAQSALNYVATAQDDQGGGWRYEPEQAGDTSVVGWQLMALKSGQMAKLMVHPASLVGANKYLDNVQIGDYGDDYGYTDPTRGTPATQAIGLLCRMYLGWPRDHIGLCQGVESLDGRGPSASNMYYNYYATQVVHHFGGEAWKRWNPRMRDMLVGRQSKDGHTAGSWYFGGGHATAGGRLYVTALAAMTLEVYYRHMPLYRIFGKNKGDQPEKKDGKEEMEEPEKGDDFPD